MTEQHVKYGLDAAAAATAVGTIAGWLPPIAALFTIVWCGMQMWTWIRRREWK